MNTPFKRTILRWHLTSDRELPAWLQRDCERDPKLAAELKAERTLSASLQRSERPVAMEPSPFLASRIKRAIAEETVERRPAFAWRPSALVGMAAAGVLVGGLAWMNKRSEPTGSTQPSGTLASVSPSATRKTSSAPVPSPDLITTAVVGTTTIVMGNDTKWTNPLKQEIANVVSDAAGAVRFLASNFLPIGLTDISEDSVKQQPAGG